MIFFRSQRRFRLALLFVSLFICAVFIQLGVSWYQRQATARATLWKEVDQVRRDLRYSTRWDLTRFRQSDFSASHFYIIDKSDLLIEVEGFFAEFGFQADLRNLQPGLQTLTEPITNETWRLMLSPLKGGSVILCISTPEDHARVDESLQENGKRFGKSLEEAEGITPGDIDRSIDHVILDERGHVKFAYGGIPLKLVHPKLLFERIKEIPTSKGPTFGLLSVPFNDPSGQRVGTINVFHELPPPAWISFHAWMINLTTSLMLAFVGTLIGARYIQNPFRPEQLLRESLQSGESSTVEFKEALRWDLWQVKQDSPDDQRKIAEKKAIAEMIAVKTVAGFLNSRLGGALCIGVADDKKIVGLDRDYESLVKPGEDRGGQDKDRDRLQVHIRNLLGGKIGPEVSNLCVETAILSWDGKDVCVVGVSPSPTSVYVDDVKGKAFYLRTGPKTVGLNIEEAVGYCQERWPRSLWTRFRWRTKLPGT